ncbi:MAG: translation initiation factor IF-2 [archaeon]|nr:translation initiation factor IF-2 [archaeon]
MAIRQPVVSVLGHVDHGKTKLLDAIRGTSIQLTEAGAITQHIGATEVPIEYIYKMCGPLIGKKRFSVPGLLFIDTPGHHSFITLRARGGSLADIAVLVIDIREGIMPQTIESIKILKQYKTPYVIALNKIDTIQGWISETNKPFALSEKTQREHTITAFNEKLYSIIGDLAVHGISADRYDRIDDFTKAVALVPISAKEGIGIPDLLLVLIGLAQRFLESQLKKDEGPGKGTILEIKEEKGLGKTLDVILYDGIMKRGDTVALGTKNSPIITKIKAILKPKLLTQRDTKDKFDSVKELHAAASVKLSCQNMEGVIAGAPVRVIRNEEDSIIEEMTEESSIKIEVQDQGITIKADAIGSLEALAYEAKAAHIPIKKYSVGEISRRDIVETAAFTDPMNRVLLAFNIDISKEAEMEAASTGVKMFSNQIIYRLIEEYQEWMKDIKRTKDADQRMEMAFPAKFTILPNCVFHMAKPAIVGIRIISGKIRANLGLIKSDGSDAGKIRSIRDGEEILKSASQGDEVAVAIDGVTVGRQIDVEDTIYVELLESNIKKIQETELSEDEKLCLQEYLDIKRKQDRFWGM